MTLIIFILGMIVGAVLMGSCIFFVVVSRVPLERKVSQVVNKVKTKGKIFDPDIDNETKQWINNLPTQ